MEYLVKIKLNVVKWKRSKRNFMKKEEKRNYYYFSPFVPFYRHARKLFRFPGSGGGRRSFIHLSVSATDWPTVSHEKEEKLFLRSPSFRALSRVKIIDPDSLSTKALQPYRRRTSPFLPSSPSFRQKLNAAIHDRGPDRDFPSRGQIVALGLNGRRVVAYFVPLTISLGGGGNLLECGSKNGNARPTRVLLPLFSYKPIWYNDIVYSEPILHSTVIQQFSKRKWLLNLQEPRLKI